MEVSESDLEQLMLPMMDRTILLLKSTSLMTLTEEEVVVDLFRLLYCLLRSNITLDKNKKADSIETAFLLAYFSRNIINYYNA